MTTTEDLVRDGLAALAPTARADAAAYAGIERAITHRRRRRTAARVAAVAAVALAAVGAGVLGADRDETPGFSTRPDATATPEPGRVMFGNATFDLPAGWAVLSDNGARMCVAPAETEDMGECAGLRLDRGDLMGYEQGPYVDHGDWSWHTGTDVMPCPDRPYDPEAPLDSVVPGDAGLGPIDTGFRPVGDRTAVYDQWQAQCDLSGFTFTPRAWHLPESELLIVDLLGHPETEAILASFEFTDGGASGG
jgi:hypothetical protein